MKISRFLQQVLQAQSDPLIVATALGEYYMKLHETQLEKYARLLNLDDSTGTFNLVTSIEDGLSAFGFSIEELQNKVSPYLLDDDPAFSDADDIIELTDIYTGDVISMSVNDFLSAAGSSADITWITAQSYKIIAQNDGEGNLTAANTFAVDCQIQLGQESLMKYRDYIMQLKQAIQGTNGVNQQVDAVSQVVGLSQALNATSANQILNESAKSLLGQYTGASPAGAWWNGLDLDFSSFTDAVDSIANVVGNVICTVVDQVGSFIIKCGEAVANWFNHTFIDPIDYEVINNDTSIQYLGIASSQIYLFNGAGDSSFDDNMRFIFERIWTNNGSNTLWFKSLGVLYKVTLLANNPVYNNDEVNKYGIQIIRYIRPLDRAKIRTLLINSGLNISTAPTEVSYDRILNWLSVLNTTDLSLPNGCSERELFLGIAAALNCDLLFNHCCYEILQRLDSPINLNIDIDISLNPSHSGYQLSAFVYDFVNDLKLAFISDLPTEAGQLTFFGKAYAVPDTITNNDFLKLITLFYSAGGDIADVTTPNNAFDSITGSLVMPNLANGGECDAFNGAHGMVWGISPLLLIANYKLYSGGNDIFKQQMFLPYLRNNSYSFKVNTRIKTDDDNAQAFAKFLIGATIAVGSAVAIFTIARPLVRIAISHYQILDAQIVSKQLKLGSAYNNPNLSESSKLAIANDYFNLVRKRNLQRLGFGSAAVSTIATAVPQYFGSGGSTEDVIRLIKG